MHFTIEPIRAEVLRFVTTSESYTIYLEPDQRLDVARCQAIEAPEGSELEAWSYMWVQALQGFFILRQPALARGRNRQPAPWTAVAQVTPAEFSSSFFARFEDEFFELAGPFLKQLPPEEVPPEDLENEDSGGQ